MPVVEQPNNISILSELRNLWKCFSITFRPRLGNQRACISLLLVCICLTLFSNGRNLCRTSTNIFTNFTHRSFSLDRWPWYKLPVHKEKVFLGCSRLFPLLSWRYDGCSSWYFSCFFLFKYLIFLIIKLYLKIILHRHILDFTSHD